MRGPVLVVGVELAEVRGHGVVVGVELAEVRGHGSRSVGAV